MSDADYIDTMKAITHREQSDIYHSIGKCHEMDTCDICEREEARKDMEQQDGEVEDEQI